MPSISTNNIIRQSSGPGCFLDRIDNVWRHRNLGSGAHRVEGGSGLWVKAIVIPITVPSKTQGRAQPTILAAGEERQQGVGDWCRQWCFRRSFFNSNMDELMGLPGNANFTVPDRLQPSFGYTTFLALPRLEFALV